MEWMTQLGQNVVNLFQTIRVTDFLDVAVIAYLAYRLMLLVRRTSAAQVAKSIVILIAALWISDLLKLNVVNFILGRAMELGVLALVIVFQPEIRKALEQLGSKRLGAVFAKEREESDLEQAVTQTVMAYTALSKDRIGALMVFERNHLLDDVLKTGTELDSRVSAELLKNLFWNKAPLHDGAVIVRGGRIIAAGCMLPMSANTNLPKELGMRHRAGIGVSEKTDAVVAIVSEETGAISVAVGGMLKRHLAPETLERLLRTELMPQEEETPAKSGFGLFRFRKGEEMDGTADEKAKKREKSKRREKAK